MTGTDFAALLLVVTAGLATTALFLYGLFHVVRGPRIRDFVSNTKDLVRSKYFPRSLARAVANPLLPPGDNAWEAAAVMNPAAIQHDGKTHLFYRAIGIDGVSRIGYASSESGIDFSNRLPYPVFSHANLPDIAWEKQQFSPEQYGSGGSWGGAEDPRAVLIKGRVYITYNAFEGWDSLRVAFTSITEDDLKAKNWRFSKPIYLSPKGERNKNWTLFPEKIDGKFVMLHNMHGENPDSVRIEYIDNLDTFDSENNSIESPDPNALPDAPVSWHQRMRSIGPPPIKTDKGWLVLYHAMDENKSRYKLGAMLLDLKNPSKIIARSTKPILEPEGQFENGGIKPGIVYACGAVVVDGMLQVYYGGADNFVCMAAVPLAEFMDHLVKGDKVPMLAPVLREQHFVRKPKVAA
jgi:predicted GH43/DUF377 family glycosyl hydrolase